MDDIEAILQEVEEKLQNEEQEEAEVKRRMVRMILESRHGLIVVGDDERLESQVYGDMENVLSMLAMLVNDADHNMVGRCILEGFKIVVARRAKDNFDRLVGWEDPDRGEENEDEE